MEIFDFLSDLFGGGGQSPQAPSSGGGSYSWIGPLISAVGNVAGRARWTPRADATASDIREANRNNMIAQLLGAGAQAYQGYQEQQAYGSLADLIKQGSMTTTTPQSPLSSQIFGWGQANPQFAKTATALGLDQLQNEQKFQSELNKARIKANQPPSFTEMAAANSYFKDLIPDPTERQAAIEEGFRQRGKSLSPSSSANNFDALRQAGETYQQTGKFGEVTLPPDTDMGAAVDALKGAAGVDEITQPEYAAPGTQPSQSQYPESTKLRNQEQARQIRQDFRQSPDYKAVFADVARGNKAFIDMVAKINEITKRGRFLPQDTFALAKIYNQILEPGLQVTEQEVKQSISSPEQWQNSALGKTFQKLTGALWLDDQNVGALLKDASAIMASRQQTARDYIQEEKNALRRLGYSEKAIEVLDAELKPLEYEIRTEQTISQLKNLSKKKSRVAEGPGIEGLTPQMSPPATSSPLLSPAMTPQVQQYSFGGKSYNIKGIR